MSVIQPTYDQQTTAHFGPLSGYFNQMPDLTDQTKEQPTSDLRPPIIFTRRSVSTDQTEPPLTTDHRRHPTIFTPRSVSTEQTEPPLTTNHRWHPTIFTRRSASTD